MTTPGGIEIQKHSSSRPPKKGGRVKIVLYAALLVALVAALGAAAYLYGPEYFKKTPPPPPPPPAATPEPAAPAPAATNTPAPSQQAAAETQEEQTPPTVEISDDMVKAMGIKTVEAQVKPLTKTIRAAGRIEYDEKRLYTINTKIEGWIEKLYVDYTGRKVKKGELMAEIYSPELLATQEEYLNALRWAGGADGKATADIDKMVAEDLKAVIKAARKRLTLWDISEAQIRQIEKRGKPMRTLSIYSPVSGYVVDKSALQGMRVMPGEKLFNVADLTTLWVLADVYESEVHSLKPGQKALITMSHIPGLAINTKVDYIYPSMEETTRTLKVRFVVDNKTEQLKPQMYTDIELNVELGRALTVPATAVIDTGQRQVVYVDRGEGNFEPRQVRVGSKSGEDLEITSGLVAGERVASAATFLLDSEAQLKGVAPLAPKESAPKKK